MTPLRSASRAASPAKPRSAAADAQETGVAATSDDRAHTQAWPDTKASQGGRESSATLAGTGPPADISVDAACARTVTNSTRSREGAPSAPEARSDANEGGADAGSRGGPGAAALSAAAGANAEAPHEGAGSSGPGHGEGGAEPASLPRGLDHAEASAAIAGAPRTPERAGADDSREKPAAPSRRAGKQKSDAERAEEDAAGLAWLARLGGRWGTDMPSTVAGWRARALSYMRESFLIGYTTVVRRCAHAVQGKQQRAWHPPAAWAAAASGVCWLLDAARLLVLAGVARARGPGDRHPCVAV